MKTSPAQTLYDGMTAEQITAHAKNDAETLRCRHEFSANMPTDPNFIAQSFGIIVRRRKTKSTTIVSVKNERITFTIDIHTPIPKYRACLALALGTVFAHRSTDMRGVSSTLKRRQKFHISETNPESTVVGLYRGAFARHLMAPEESIENLESEGVSTVRMSTRLLVPYSFVEQQKNR